MIEINELKILTICIGGVQLLLELIEHGGGKRAATLPDINQFLYPNLFDTDTCEFIIHRTWGRRAAGQGDVDGNSVTGAFLNHMRQPVEQIMVLADLSKKRTF